MKEEIKKQFEEHIETIKNNYELFDQVEKATNTIIEALKSGNKVLVCGNGGSAADSQHIAAELLGKFEKKRKALAAIALTTDTSMLTAWSNDDCYENIFSRQVEGLGKEGDVLVGLTTSGNSENIIRAMNIAKEIGMKTIGFNGKNGGQMKEIADVNLIVKHNRTSRIQEAHQLCYHIICFLVEKKMFENS